MTPDAKLLLAETVAALTALAIAWKLFTDWRNAPLSREQQLLDMMHDYSDQLAKSRGQLTENQEAATLMQKVFDQEIYELRVVVVGLRDRVAWLEKLLRDNNIEVAPLEKRASDRKTLPRPV